MVLTNPPPKSFSEIYHPRKPEESPLWKLFDDYYKEFEDDYEAKFEKKYGFLRPVIGQVSREYLKCGDLKEGFARIRCPDCHEEYLLAFSCKGRWFCPSCQAKKVIQFGEFLENEVLYPIPHRQYVFSIPIMLRIYFKYDRSLLGKLCRCAYDSITVFLREVIGLAEGAPGVVMTIQTFGDYPDRFHPHIHTIVADGLFTKTGTFFVMPKVNLKPLEDIFRAKVFKMLKKEGKIGDETINTLMQWRHSGFNVHNEVRIKKDDEKGREALAQYIIRNTFSLEKMIYNEDSGTVIYHSKMTHGKDKKNFEVYSAVEFIAAITQHIPDKAFQMVRYYGWYSNKTRGVHEKEGFLKPGAETDQEKDIEIIDVSDYQPKRIPPKTWRECIKKIYEIDPLICRHCGGEMKIIGFITDLKVIRKILEHLGIWKQKSPRAPPQASRPAKEITYEYGDDYTPDYIEPFIQVN